MGGGASERLDRYRAMRDFQRTPEPAGGDEAAPDRHRFVVQEHHATALHWDLRLERDGVLVSWAVPKGIPRDPRENHLAVHTEDHPLSYLDFEGHIPEGEYGGGRMTIWDRGTYDWQKWDDREVMVTLHGERARGRYVLFRTEGKQWMMHRMDPPEDPGREPMPTGLRPIPLRVARLPEDQEAWSFEAAWGGQRVLVSSEGGRIRVHDEPDGDVTDRYPELRDLGRAIGAVAVILDGEIVATGPEGRPDARALGRRAEARNQAALRRMAARAPVAFLAADVAWLEGHATTPIPYRQRRQLLERLSLAGPSWRMAPSHPGEGATLLEASRAQGLPGVVARRLNGGYEEGNLVFVPTSA
ncbi:MAG: ATP-dependent DNA ligase [Actinomycetota bacterium]|nr:ATP-dependent DNA ligase [Actinomycetota bacterium]